MMATGQSVVFQVIAGKQHKQLLAATKMQTRQARCQNRCRQPAEVTSCIQLLHRQTDGCHTQSALLSSWHVACAYRYWSLLSVDQLEGSEPEKLFLLMSLQRHAMSI
jgi:hypothetical protein